MTTADERAREVIDYLTKHNPEVMALLKDMTTSDVHQTTALGNQDKKKKKMNFSEALAAGKEPKVIPDDGAGKASETEKRDVVEWALPFQIMKAEPDQQLIFGWASISTVDGKIVVDKQDDVILPEDLEKAAYDFVLFNRSHGDMHNVDQSGRPIQMGRMVESMMFTKQKQDILKIDLGVEGWWVGFKVDNTDLWAAHKRGERPEFSIGGRGRRISV